MSGSFLLPLLVFGALVEDDNSPISTAHQPVFLFPRKELPKWIFYPPSSLDFFCQTFNLEQANIKKATIGTLVISNGTNVWTLLYDSFPTLRLKHQDGNFSEILVFGNYCHFWYDFRSILNQH